MTLTPGQLAARGDFYFQLSSLVGAGVPLIQALEMARKQRARGFAGPLQVVLAKLQAGHTFGESLAAAGGWLPDFDLAVISAGEQSGRLEQILRMLGNYYKERSTLLRRILSDLAYPLFILHMAVFIFPTSTLTGIFMNGGVETMLWQKASILVPIYVTVLFAVFALQGNRGKKWRATLERILHAVPLVGKARSSLALARFSAGLEALLSAGVPVIESWEIAGNASGSNRINRFVTTAVPKVRAGLLPSEALNQSSVFPELFRNLYVSGEVSGQLDVTLQRLYRHYQEDATLRFHNIALWAPKMLFLLVALAIGYQVISFYLGYFKQIDELGI